MSQGKARNQVSIQVTHISGLGPSIQTLYKKPCETQDEMCAGTHTESSSQGDRSSAYHEEEGIAQAAIATPVQVRQTDSEVQLGKTAP